MPVRALTLFRRRRCIPQRGRWLRVFGGFGGRQSLFAVFPGLRGGGEGIAACGFSGKSKKGGRERKGRRGGVRRGVVKGGRVTVRGENDNVSLLVKER